MFFRKKVKLTDFLEGPYLETVLEDGSFRHESFYEDYCAALSDEISPGPTGGPEIVLSSIVDRDLFTVTFLGAFLWLLKYRTLSTNRNSPRKLAFLDMLFDMEMPGVIDSHFDSFDTDRIKEVYELMDIRCKKEYTGEVTKGEPPPFLVSPIWIKNVHPHPLKVAAKVFSQLVESAVPDKKELPPSDRFTDELARLFIQMTAPVEKVSSEINFTWSTPKQEKE